MGEAEQRRQFLRWPAAASLAAAVLLCPQQASAGNILRRPASGGPTSGMDPAAAAAANAAVVARQQASPLAQAMNAIKAWQAGQDAARAAASAGSSTVPDGLGTGALDPLSGTGIGMPTQTASAGHFVVDLVQTDPRAIMNWNTFNVGRNTDVHFDQSKGGVDAASWVAMNRVSDPSGRPSQILGSIKAEGQVYVINRNGVIFGGTSQVNVGTLVLSGLDLAGTTDPQFLTGALSLSSLSFGGQGAGVQIQAGAVLKANGGRLVLVGQQVQNAGSLQSDDGQVLLAAGSRVSLSPSSDLSLLRGLTVTTPDGADAPGFLAENSGIISAARGNVTLLGATTRQDGLATVTNGAEKNGSISIGGNGSLTTFGPGSLTQILPDPGGKKAIGTADSYRPSSINAGGNEIDVLDGARLYAPAGTITVAAQMTSPQPLNTTDPALLDTSRIYLGSGASLDVSGLADVPVAMEQNTIVAQLRANELRDNPLVRAGALRGRTVDFDGRLGGHLSDGTGVANLGGYYDLLQRDVAQLMTSGGSIALNANQIVTRPGSTVDLSGGNLRYADGYVRRTILVDPTGKRVPIEKAVLGVPYVGIDGDFVALHPRWGVTETFTSSLNQSAPRFEAGYTQGSAAGTLSLGTTAPIWYLEFLLNNPAAAPLNPSAVAAFRVFEGDVVARTVNGPAQRGAPSGTTSPTLIWQQQPLGAALSIGAAGDVSFSGAIAPLGPGFGPGSAVDPSRLYKHVLPAAWFDGNTFSTANIGAGTDTTSTVALDRTPGGHLTIGSDAVLRLGDYGSFTFSGKGAEIEGQLIVPGGKVSLTTLNLGDDGKQSLTLHLGASALIDVAGRMTNDALDGAGHPLRPLKGGSVSLTGGRILLDAGSLIDVTGGAALNSSGAKLTAGDGGSITIDVSRYPAHFDTQDLVEPYQGELQLLGRLDGRALGRGGSLSIRTGHDVVIGAALPGDALPGTLLFAPDFFGQGGFASYSIRGGDRVTVAAGTVVSPAAFTLVSPENPAELPTGAKLADVSGSAVLPSNLRSPMQLSLSAVGGPSTLSAPARLTLAAGAAIRMEPGSSVALSGDLIQVDGTIESPGGSISASNVGTSAGSGIVIGDTARLLAPGYTLTNLAGGVPVRSVQPGGSVTLFSRNQVVIAPEAVIDVSGVPGVADLPVSAATTGTPGGRYQPVQIDGDAGRVVISAGSGILGGKLNLAAGGPTGRGGELDVTALGAQMFITQKQAGVSPGGLWLVADSVDASGADDLSIAAVREDNSFTYGEALTFAGDVTLSTDRSIQILAPMVGTVPGVPANVHLRSSYVSLDGQPALDGLKPQAPAAGAGSFTVDADVIDLSRTLVLGCASGPAGDCTVGGFSTAAFNASGDIRLSDHDLAGNQGTAAGLISGGEIDFHAAQIYVSSRIVSPGSSSIRLPTDPGFLIWSGERIRVASNGAPAPVPLSFGERLTLRAPDIEQGGVVRAPQGEIRLEGRDADGQPAGSVNLLPGSVTSASLVPDGGGAAVTVPFGSVLNGPVFNGYSQPGESPPKAVKLDAPSVAVAPGAVVDVSGGGSVQGYSFVPSNNGSSDVLAFRTDASGHVVTDASGNPLAAPALGLNLPAPFAIVPGLGTQPVPVGRSSDLRDPRLRVGDQIWLQGVAGIPDGYYTLLPAHYALLPGGLLVEPLQNGFGAAGTPFTRPDGATIAFGYRSHVVRGANGNDRRLNSPGFSQIAVLTSDTFLKYSQLTAYDLGQTAAALATAANAGVRVPADAGSIVFAAQTSLSLRGTGRMGAGAGGLLGNLDISGAKIAVVGPGASAPDGYLVLNEADLTAFGAGSILVGGTRSTSAPGTSVAVTASDVVVDTGGAVWSAPEILLAGTSTVTIADGSRLRAEGTAAVDKNPLLLKGDGAFFRLSNGARVGLSRSGIPASPIGSLTVGSASLFAAGSLAVEGAAAVSISPQLAFSTPQLDIASGEVHLGAVAPAGATGTWLSKDQIEQLARFTDLLIRGHDAIDLHGSFDVGTRSGGQATLPSLTLDTGLLQDVDGGVVTVTAGKLTLQDSGSSGAGVAGAGALKLDVDSLAFGAGAVRLAGFGVVAGTAGATSIAGSGSFSLDGSLSLATGSLTAASGATYAVITGGDLRLGSFGSAGAPSSMALGAALSLQGASVSIDTAVVLPSGTFSANAVAGALAVGPLARIDVSGQQIDFSGVVKQSPGGTIRLGATGDVSVAGGAVLDVSGAAQAGAVSVNSTGQASLLGTMKAAGSSGGSFSLDAGSLPSFTGLDALLAAGGFTDSISVRLRAAGQDIRIDQGQAVAAHDVTLRSDQGQVVVAGTVGLDGDASHAAGGRIELFGGGGVKLAGTARIDARAAASESGGYSPASGQVVIAAGQSGAVDIGGATIDVSGGRSGGGAVVVRAPRAGADGIVVARLDANVIGATERVLQGLQTYDATAAGTIDGTWFAVPLSDAAAWLSAAQARYPSGFNGFTLAPAVVAKSGGDMAIAGSISLAGAEGPGYVGFVSGGKIDLQGVVSDGFASAARGATLLSGQSATLSFEAVGDLTIEKNAMIRTGTGDIAIRTGGSLVLADSTSVVYTAGRHTASAPGFLGAPSATAFLGELPVDGGSIDVVSGRDIEMPLATQSTSAWLFRFGDTNWGGDVSSSSVRQQTSWSIVFGNFEQGIGALGGGDVRVAAAGEVRQLQIAIPTTGQLTTSPGQMARAADLVVRGGGDLRVEAGSDLVGGLFMLGEGRGDLRAGGSVTPSDRPADLRGLRTAPGVVNQGVRKQVGAIFGLMDAEVEMTAAGSVLVEGAYDPARQPQNKDNVVSGLGSAFWGYSDRAALDATGLSGPVRYENDPWASLDLTLGHKYAVDLGDAVGALPLLNAQFANAPPTLRLDSLQSSVYVEDRFTGTTLTLAPAATGTLEILAGQNAFLARSVALGDVAPRYAHGPLDAFSTNVPTVGYGVTLNLPASDALATNSERGFVPLHQADPDPVRIYALSGSVCAQRTGSCVLDNPINLVAVVAPKPIEVIAGTDVVRGSWQPQNNGSADLSVLEAGRDLQQPLVIVTGAGSLLLQAGRNVVLGQGGTQPSNILAGGAVYSLGNGSPPGVSLSDPTQSRALNQALPADRAADVYILAGDAAGRANYDGFAAAYLDPANGRGVVRTYLPELRAFMTGIDAGRYGALGDADLVRAFDALSSIRRELFLDRIYFTELQQTGIDYNDPASSRFQSYNRGFRAEKTLFPVDPASLSASARGDIILSGKAIETEADASIVLLAPYGGVQVGTVQVPAFFDEGRYGGVITRRGGDVQIMADQNIDLFTSRVFTLQGGDITMWTSDGSITAGAGSKTSVFQRPLAYTMTRDAVVAVDAFGLQTGAGIGVLDALGNASGRVLSRLDLIAPRGEVNAGDAGIRVVGDLNIAAAVVVGVENIQATGAASGVPKVEVPNIGSLTAASQVVQAAAKEGGPTVAQVKNAAADLPSIITVEVVGYETTDPQDKQKDRKK